ncbi:hypothetical protein ACH4LN_16075 [Streptomyces albus]|nr:MULTISPECIES: hypothetical protein [Streptomyces]UVN59393.1 hypothetical protein NR995_06315 [Streptomyces albus]
MEWAREGPAAAVVESVEVTEPEPQGHSMFQVRDTALPGTD